MTLFEKKQEILRLNQQGLSTNELTELLNEYALIAIEPYLTTPKFLVIIGRYVLRAACFPFFTALSLIYSLLMFFVHVINFIRWGGQSIGYTRHVNYKSIADVYIKLEKFINEKAI